MTDKKIVKLKEYEATYQREITKVIKIRCKAANELEAKAKFNTIVKETIGGIKNHFDLDDMVCLSASERIVKVELLDEEKPKDLVDVIIESRRDIK